ncbi:MAG: antibiotic biosynthesis monooxygenase [Muribaculaceae bacterium]|nr:antibiotic biosynthesis monooxygenase [Muribaculaceae bacterium]MDE6119413.1 antibiotic biosynthesis monooxygenase [Muribaculaceae bacterium]MDE6316640.1 antibiotic biosynthesis monooxygenase [Muribaculaceae bacterium]
MIRLNVFIHTTNPDNRQALINAAVKLEEYSRNDAGVVSYEAFSALTSDTCLFICETWQDETSLANHMETEHFRSLVGEMEKLGTLTLEKFTF